MKTDLARVMAVLLPLLAGPVAAADWRVWTVTETRHVLRSEPPGGSPAVQVAAARNEWVSFQILVRSDEPVKAVRVEAAELHGPGAVVLQPSESRLYRQHQLLVEVGTYRNEAFKPDWYPDPLIPLDEPVTGKRLEGGRLRAMPFALPANETHGFWVDLYVPVDTPPGNYRGAYRVTAEGGKSLEIPVTLTVWGFTLPHTPTLVTAFGSPAQGMRDYYRQQAKEGKGAEPSDWQAVQTQCAQLLSEHCVNATPPAEMLRPVAQEDGSFRIPGEQVQALREFVDRYHVNALEIPHPSSVIKDPQAEHARLHAWLAAFDRMAKELGRPQVVFYIYLKDEPNTREDYEYVQRWGRAIRDAKSVAQVMVVEQTWTEPGNGGADSAWGDLYGAVDIWCPLFSLHRQDSAAKRQALGESVWTYTALCQGQPTPWWHIDYPLLNYRVPAWMAWRDRMKGLLYWGGMSYWRQTDDPWVHVPVYTGRGEFQQGDKGIRFNGEGSLVYPARAVGYDGIVPTVRLKVLRDAIEDYEYLAILTHMGRSTEADRVVRRLTESWYQWDKEPAAYDKARAELAAMIAPTALAAEPPPWAAKDLRAGMIGTDTSHVPEFTNLFRSHPEWRVQVVAAFKGGSPDLPTSADRVEKFAATIHDQFGAEIVGSIEELLQKVDVVLLESVDGRPHLAQATPVLRAGKRLFIDKPLAASLEDVRRIVQLSNETGTPFFSCSSYRFHPEFPQLREKVQAGKVSKVQASSPFNKLEFHPDLYFYGIHGVEALYAVMGTGCVSVSRRVENGADITTGQWKDGRVGVYYGAAKDEKMPVIRLWSAEGTIETAGDAGYERLVRAIAEFFQTGGPPVAPAETVEIFEFMTAAQRSNDQGGARVSLDELRR